MIAEYIEVDGTVHTVKPLNGKDFSLDELQHYVKGYIEIVYLKDGTLLVVNEEGKLNELPINQVATNLYNNSNDIIVGNVLHCSKNYIK